MPLLSSSRLFVCFFVFSRARESSQEREREKEREREFYFFIFFRTRFVVSMTWALLWLLYSPLFYIISLDNVFDVLKKGPKKERCLSWGVSFFWSQKSSSFFFQEERTKRRSYTTLLRERPLKHHHHQQRD